VTFKRALDLAISAIALVLLSPLFAVVAVLIKATSSGPVLFRQERMGLHCKPFTLLKFRTMRVGAHEAGPLVTAAGDTRVTPLGRFLRKSKVDEFPQLWNVLRGDMSLVGPRPQTRRYFECYREEYGRVLARVKPGITDYAAISYRDEEGLLARHSDPEEAYIKYVIPQKMELYEKYVERMSLLTDLKILARTALVILNGGSAPHPERPPAPVVRLEPHRIEVREVAVAEPWKVREEHPRRASRVSQA
jgi:lipopolysaccharide/colanic/teichoic acid biosynthesis glycosyltransferase